MSSLGAASRLMGVKPPKSKKRREEEWKQDENAFEEATRAALRLLEAFARGAHNDKTFGVFCKDTVECFRQLQGSPGFGGAAQKRIAAIISNAQASRRGRGYRSATSALTLLFIYSLQPDARTPRKEGELSQRALAGVAEALCGMRSRPLQPESIAKNIRAIPDWQTKLAFYLS